MKTLLLSLCVLALFFTSCQSDPLSNINSGVKVIGKCCKDISAAGAEGCAILKPEAEKKEGQSSSSSLLPSYSWDAKQMLW